MKILFVCTGNTCRSPMAQVLANQKAKQLMIDKMVKFDSAGLVGPANQPMTDGAKLALKLKGIRSGAKKSKVIEWKKLNSYKFIITMTDFIKQKINLPNCFSIYDFCGFEILDPYMQSQEIYNNCADEIEKAINIIFDRILTRSMKNDLSSK